MSKSPPRRRGAISSDSPSARLTSTPGWEVRNLATASGTSVAPAVGKEAIRNRPPRPPAIAATSASASSIRVRIPSAWPASTAPAAVGRTPRRSRSINGAPSSPSSVAIACDTADCE